MSQKRFEKLRRAQIDSFHKKTVESLNKDLVPIIDEINTIIFGGNTIRAKELLKRKDIDHRLRAKIHDEVIPTSDVGNLGLLEAKKQVATILKEHELAEEKQHWDKFIRLLMKESPRAVYGLEEIIETIQEEMLETLLILDNNTRALEDMISIQSRMKPPKRIVYFSEETEPGQQLKSFGGYAGIKYW